MYWGKNTGLLYSWRRTITPATHHPPSYLQKRTWTKSLWREMPMSADNKPIYVAGLGLISAIGRNVTENLHALENGQAGSQPIRHLDTEHTANFSLAQVKASNQRLALLT